jgi:hypothetical protein
MKRLTRFLLHTFLPPALGAIFILISMWAIEGGRLRHWFELPVMVGLFLIYGYVFAILPSLAYAALMELGYHRGLTPGRRGAQVLSAVLGFLVGAIPMIGSLLGENGTLRQEKVLGLGVWAISGLLTGLIIEWWIGCRCRRPLTPSSSAPSRTSPPP